jgi:hypothetical protein
MNEILKSIKCQSSVVRDDYQTGMTTVVIDYQMFADLLIQECIELFEEDATIVGHDLNKYYVRGIIKKHFGVK